MKSAFTPFMQSLLISILALATTRVTQAAPLSPVSANLTTLANPIDLMTLEDKTLVTLFWGSWCSICKDKMAGFLPEIEGKGLAKVITIAMDKQDDRALKSVKKESIRFPVFRDLERTLTKELKVFAVPHWAVYKKNASGNWLLVESQPGFDDQQVLAAIQKN